MSLRVILIFTAIKTLLIFRQSVYSQVVPVLSENVSLATTLLKCPKNVTLCLCKGGYPSDQVLDCTSLNAPADPEILEQQIEREIQAIQAESRKDNILWKQGTIQLKGFYMYSQDIQNLDLGLLDGFSVEIMGIRPESSHSSTLEKIVGGLDQRSVFQNVKHVFITSNPRLDDAGLGDTLKAFSSSANLITLDLSKNVLTGSDEKSELLPGLSSLVFLEYLDLNGNKITKISTAHFRNLVRLTNLDLHYNHIVSVKGSLVFVPHNFKDLHIDLRFNLINEMSFSVGNISTSNFTINKKSISLDLRNNKLSTLPFDIFDDILQSNQNNAIYLQGNPLSCDKRVQWLRETENVRFLTQIKGARCSNLQGVPLFKKAANDSEFVCPEPGQIRPCTCDVNMETIIICEGELILQENIDNMVNVLRQELRKPQNQQLDIQGSLFISNTILTELDLTSLFDVKMVSLRISENQLLKTVKSGQMAPERINVNDLVLRNNPELDDEGLGDILKLFSHDMKILDLSGNSLRGHFKFESNLNSSATKIETMEREFLPGLAQLYNIYSIYLDNNKIEHLGVGRFRNNPRTDFGLANNTISILQKNIFFKSNFKGNGELVKIDLRWNLLTENSFPLNVFGSRRMVLNLENNTGLSTKYLYPLSSGWPSWSFKTWRAISLGLIYDNISSSRPSLVCPKAEEILPCLCIENYAEIVCNGSSVTQKSVEILFRKLKDRNGKTNNELKLIIQKFKLFDTSMIEMDLSPLIDCRISTLFIFGNSKLTKITSSNFLTSSLIVVKDLIVEKNPNLLNSGIENLLTHFEPEIETLSLADNSLTLNQNLKGLSNLRKLKVLDLRANFIAQLLPEFFNGVINRQLEHLDLSENQIEQIYEDAFGFSSDENSDKTSDPLVINLNFNRITENSFSWNLTGLEKLKRPIQLNLVGNKMTTLPFAPFHALLTRENKNVLIDLYGNPLDCDWRLNWLEKTEVWNTSSNPSIGNAECVNQPRKFIHNFQKSDIREFCSEITDLSPCSCSSSSSSLECVGDQVEDEPFQQLVLKIRRLDPFCLRPTPKLDRIVFRSTKLTQLDLTNIFATCLTNLTSFIVDSNMELTRIVGPPLVDSSMRKFIKVQNLEITSNPLTNEGLGSSLKYFSPEMETLVLNGNQLKGNSNSEFLSGLSSLKNLERIELNSNQIIKLSNGLFQNKSKLRRISFVGNKISEITSTAFDFSTDLKNSSTVVIDLSLNFLSDDSFDKSTFLVKTSRPLNLVLSRNRFTTISAVPFQNFLEANSENVLNFKDNVLKCDEQLDWIKTQKEKFNQSRILSADCDGVSIFYSKYFNSVVETVIDVKVLQIVLGVVIPAFLILMLVAIFLWRKFRRVQDRLFYLSAKDIDEFRKGNSNINALHIHAAVMSRPFDENLEISRDLLEFDEKGILGSGQYGIVYKGILKSAAGNVCVALKTVKASADLETFKSLLSEVKILDYLGSHQNVVRLLGASTANIRNCDVLAVLEFCQNGDLRSYILRWKNNFQDIFADARITEPLADFQNSCENSWTTIELVKFAMGIANGLKFLRTKNVIHGDLAARNVLLTGKLETKISDFGLSRQLANYQNYLKSTKCALPFKWMSVESIKSMEFSTCSDIWSFGVVLYEIFSLGEMPYPGLAVDQEFLPRLLRGYRMEKPKYADQQIYDLMLDTWKLDPLERPSAGEILCRLYQVLDRISSATESNSCVYIDC